ncbi:MAG: Eco57I restriction-modification methylase domain-containing protein [Bacteroidales bacterium]|nr:Eco57I restriction-modification methylase domain-containing protein [Bacteroidales bacterium]
MEAIKKKHFNRFIENFDFENLFNQLGWNYADESFPKKAADEIYNFNLIADKAGFSILICLPDKNGQIPEAQTRKKIHSEIAKLHHEHLIIFIDKDKTIQQWELLVREPNKPVRTVSHKWRKGQAPELLYQKLSGAFFSIEEDEEGSLTIIDVVERIKQNFGANAEKVTKKFYAEFKKQHTQFLEFISGIEDVLPDKENSNKQWYSSLMLNRLMFCYFIQKKGFLNEDRNYLQNKLKECQVLSGKDNFYSFYRSFLLELFHDGLAKPESKRKTDLPVDMGKIPYLNGGLFDVHELEKQFDKINIDDTAFEKIFNFFDNWEWHLDTRENAEGNTINPDVIGYIFEKYINDRAAMGAYYTKEDITEYISKNTILPFLFDETKRNYEKAFENDADLWNYLRNSADDYIYDPVKHGVSQSGGLFDDLPDEIKAGFNNKLENQIVKEDNNPHLWELRKQWNLFAPQEIALPTETYRELIDRRKRYAEIKAKIANGELTSINDFITYNLNIRQFTQDYIETCKDPKFIQCFYKALNKVTILDPTCGSGAFLFAAMNILEPLYETCLKRMEEFTEEEPEKHNFFEEVLNKLKADNHPNLQYFIFKSIILNNLYGVDIMREAVEIAKLRLFLKLVATVDVDKSKKNFGLEPLPDIDFNIRAGNTLIGFANEKELLETIKKKDALFAEAKLEEFKEEFEMVGMAYMHFQNAQLINNQGSDDFRKAKTELFDRLKELNQKLNHYLATNYGINAETQKDKYQNWLQTHQPFHWFAEFYEIVAERGGFDCIIGNPPYVQYTQYKYGYALEEKLFKTFKSSNLYAYVFERSQNLMKELSRSGMIVQISCLSTPTMESMCQQMLKDSSFLSVSNYATRPAYLFDGVTMNLTIILNQKKLNNIPTVSSTHYIRWVNDNRNILFQDIGYSVVENQNLYYKYAIPKITKNEENRMIGSIIKQKNTVRNYLNYNNTPTKNKMHYRTAGGRYFKIFIDKEFGTESKSNKSKYFSKNSNVYEFIALLSSNIWWWWYTLHFDMYNCKDYMMYDFPYVESSDNKIISLGKELAIDLVANADSKIQNYETTGKREQLIFKPSKSKPIIDQIDTLLAEHYGFTESELDFIINYDIKYRMGKSLEAYVNGTLGEEEVEVDDDE